MPRQSKVYTIPEEKFCQIIQNAVSIRDAALKIGLSAAGSNSYYQIKKRCSELNLDLSHFNQNQTEAAIKASTKYSLDDIMIENSPYQNTSRLKSRIISANLIPYKCAICGNEGLWNGQPLILQLDHINGKHNDHRLENLRFLCPNCHSQTETFSGKNK